MDTKEKISELVKTKFEEGLYGILGFILDGITQLGDEQEITAAVKVKITKDGAGIAIDGAENYKFSEVKNGKIPLTLFDPDAPDLFEESEAGND
jgi:hypothetical protein